MQRAAKGQQTHTDYLQRYNTHEPLVLTHTHYHRELSGLASGLEGLADNTETHTSTAATALDSILSQVCGGVHSHHKLSVAEVSCICVIYLSPTAA